MAMNPICPYYGNCGGCSLQNLSYEKQLEQKKNALADALNCADFDATKILVVCDEPFGYRNRMDFAFWSNWIAKTGRDLAPGDSGKDRLGLRVKGKWFEVVDLKECAISNAKLNELLKEVRKFFIEDRDDFDAYDLKKKTGTFRYAVVRAPKGDNSICFVLNSDSTRLDEAITLVKEFARKSSANNISVLYVASETDVSTGDDFFVVKGNESLISELMGRKFEFSVQGFFQNNSEMAEKMHQYVHGILSESARGEYSYLLDLYGGVGTFAINNADLFHKVLTVEAFAPAIETAKKNIDRNGVKNADAMVLDAQYIKRLDLPSKDLFVVTDPPRSGMHPKTIEHLKKIKPSKIIYISCNVQQLKCDLPKFKDYKVKSAAVFDLFPQTPHMESVVEMELK